MKKIVVEFTEKEAQITSHALEREYGQEAWNIELAGTKQLREQFIDRRNVVEDAKNKLDKALGAPKETK